MTSSRFTTWRFFDDLRAAFSDSSAEEVTLMEDGLSNWCSRAGEALALPVEVRSFDVFCMLGAMG